MNTLKTQLAELQNLQIGTYGKDFLLTWEKTDDEIRALTLVAECFYQMHKTRKPFRVFETGLAETVRWYCENESWWRPIKSGVFESYYRRQYGARLAGSSEAAR